MAPKNTPEFAARIREAVAASGLTQTQIAKRGGPSDTTLRKLMDGEPVGISAVTMKKLDIGLGWTPGSSVRVYQGGQPAVADDEYREKARDAAIVREKVGDIYDRLEREGRLAQQREDPAEPDVLDLLIELLGDLPDGGSREKVQQLYDELAIRDFDQLFQRLSRRGKVQVVRHAGRILLLEENGTPVSSFFAGSAEDHVTYPTPEEFERNRHDVTPTSTTSSSEGEADPHEKNGAADRRDDKSGALTPPDKGDELEHRRNHRDRFRPGPVDTGAAAYDPPGPTDAELFEDNAEGRDPDGPEGGV